MLLIATVLLITPGLLLTVLRASPVAAAANRLCARLGHIPVHNQWGKFFVVRNDNFGGRAECLRNRGRRANFRVIRSAADSGGPESMAYPDVFLGCSWSVCSRDSGLPVRVRRLHRPEATWHTVQHAGGVWNAAFDIWFSKTPDIASQANGTELMIWLNTRGFARPSRAPVVRVDHTLWYLLHWVPQRDGVRWNYVMFRRVQPVRRVDHLRLHPFLRELEHRGLLRARWYLLNIEAGFEIWRGGTGLGTTAFWARTLLPI